MRQAEVKRQLKTAMRQAELPIRPEHLEQTKLLAQKEPRRYLRRDSISFVRFLALQIRFIGWKIWLLQAGLLAAISCVLAASMGAYFLDDPRYVALLLCCLSVLILLSALPFIHRSLQYKMHEIEAATRFSSARLLLAKLLIVAVGDVLMLTGLLCFAVLKTPLSTSGTMLYLLFPFLLAGCGLLYLLGRLAAARFVAAGLGLGFALVAAFSLLAGLLPAFYQQTFSLSWAAVCLLLLAACVGQFRRLVHGCCYAERQLA